MQYFSVDSEHLVVSLIGVLLHGCRPPAIVRAVATRIVNAIKGVAIRARTHVLGKALWIVPALADADSSAALQIKIFIIFVVASSHHAHPSFVERMAKHSVFDIPRRGRGD
jgi:hypothetical protein